MNKNGNRIIYDGATGVILYQTYDSEGANPHQEISELKYVDLPFGFINYDTHYIGSINKDGEPIIKMKELSPTELENAKLKEDIILLQADAEAGGIL